MLEENECDSLVQIVTQQIIRADPSIKDSVPTKFDLSILPAELSAYVRSCKIRSKEIFPDS